MLDGSTPQSGSQSETLIDRLPVISTPVTSQKQEQILRGAMQVFFEIQLRRNQHGSGRCGGRRFQANDL